MADSEGEMMTDYISSPWYTPERNGAKLISIKGCKRWPDKPLKGWASYSDITQQEVKWWEKWAIYGILALMLPLFVVVCLGAIVVKWVVDKLSQKIMV